MSLRICVVGLLGLTFASGCLDVPAPPITPKCSSALLWAKQTGIVKEPAFYEEYPFLNPSSTLEDFQLALFLMTKNGIQDDGQECVFPCSASPQALYAAQSKLIAASVVDPQSVDLRVVSNGVSSYEQTIAKSGLLWRSGDPPTLGPTPTPTLGPTPTPTPSPTLPQVIVTTTTSAGSSGSLDSSGSGSSSASSASMGSLASSDSGSSGGSSASSATWAWWAWLLLALAVCCLLPLLCLACAAMLCYESVAWIFGGKKSKRAVKKNTPSKVIAQPQAPSTSYSAPAPQQALPTVMSAVPMYTAAPAVSYSAPAVPTTYSAPVPTSYVSTPQFQVAPQMLAPARSVSVAPQQAAYIQQPAQFVQPAIYSPQPMQYVQQMLDRDGDGRVSREEFAALMRR